MVAADGFTFCVPPGWHGSGRTWRRGEGSVTWGTGAPPRTAVRTEVRTVPASEIETTPAGVPDSDLRRFTEVIGGQDAQVWRNRFGGAYYTGVRWDGPRVWLTGEAGGPETADLQLKIFRTVRFSPR